MSSIDRLSQLSGGKEDRPVLFSWGEIVYDHHDIDGLYTMLDKDFSGCIILTFTKSMNHDTRGRVLLDGKEIRQHFLKYMPIMGNRWVLAVRVRGVVREYGKCYTLHVEGFRDTDGNEMEPQDFQVKCEGKVFPDPKYVARELVALEAAEEGIVLLENKNYVLPLAEGTVLNLFGRAIHQFRTGAVGAGKINPRYIVDFVEAVRDSGKYKLNEELVDFYGCDGDLVPDEETLQRALEKSDTAVMLITRGSGENLDNSSAKGEFYLSEEEEALLHILNKTFSHLIVVLNVAYPMDVSFVGKYRVEGLIYSGLGGMMAGKALLNVISGDANPSGKLPDTWAKDYFDIPSSRNFYDCVDKPRLDADCGIFIDTCYEEDIYVGYRYFTTFGKPAAYPFGYGRSYTDFLIHCDKFSFDKDAFDKNIVDKNTFDNDAVEKNTGLSLSCKVSNTGKVAGKEVIQVYVQPPAGGLEKPSRILVEFEKTGLLKPGETQNISFSIAPKYLASYDEEKAEYICEAGEYTVFVGNDVNAPECGRFLLEEPVITRKVSNLMNPGQDLSLLSQKDALHTWPKGKASGVKEDAKGFEPRTVRKKYAPQFNGKKPDKKITYTDVKKTPSLAEDFVAQLSLEELARISVCGSAGWGMEGIGEAGHIVPIEGYEMPEFPVSDGNSGVNLNVKNIGMPSGVTICASFNKRLSEKIGRVIGEEARELGMPMILAPALNIHRNPLNGRQPEYFSEDPYLAGVMAGFYARGMEEAGVASCMKHLLANNCESSRKRNMSIMSERALREIYFRAFEILMDVHMPASVMTAYNACNGQPTAADEELLQGLLREENGFDGFIMTDWGTYDSVDVAEMVQAGNCWITPGTLDDTYTKQIVRGVENGKIQLERLQENVTRIIRTMIRFV